MSVSVRLAPVNTARFRFAPVQRRLPQIGMFEVRLSQVRALQIRPSKVGSAEIGPAQVRTTQVRSPQVRVGEGRADQGRFVPWAAGSPFIPGLDPAFQKLERLLEFQVQRVHRCIGERVRHLNHHGRNRHPR